MLDAGDIQNEILLGSDSMECHPQSRRHGQSAVIFASNIEHACAAMGVPNIEPNGAYGHDQVHLHASMTFPPFRFAMNDRREICFSEFRELSGAFLENVVNVTLWMKNPFLFREHYVINGYFAH